MSYSDLEDHRSMVFDPVRNAAYLDALKRVVGSATRVMDLGAGVGVHGLNAAGLGAAEVLLVEPASVIEVARKLAQENGLDNVACHRCAVEALQYDQKVDVIVSVFTGNFLLGEDLLPSLFHARDRFLAPGGHLIPDRARMLVCPVSVPAYYAKHIDVWGDPEAGPHACGDLGLDFAGARAYAANALFCDSRKEFNPVELAAPAELLEMDFHRATDAGCDVAQEVSVARAGTCHGWLGWFDMRLGEDWLSTGGEPDETHWNPAFLPLAEPLELSPGDTLFFALKRPQFGEWTWTTGHAGSRQRQSTFLSRPQTPANLLRTSGDYRPELDARGRAAGWVLTEMRGRSSVNELAQSLLERFPGEFHGEAEALAFVRELAEAYS